MCIRFGRKNDELEENVNYKFVFIIQFLINYLSSGVKISLFSRYSEMSERSTKVIHVVGHTTQL